MTRAAPSAVDVDALTGLWRERGLSARKLDERPDGTLSASDRQPTVFSSPPRPVASARPR